MEWDKGVLSVIALLLGEKKTTPPPLNEKVEAVSRRWESTSCFDFFPS